jgi:hypothetical protein
LVVASIWGVTPRQSIEAECRRTSRSDVVDRCLALLRGDVDESFLFVAAGPGARTVVAGGEGGLAGYWPRTWALRALLYAWEDRATSAVLAATDDDHWRVREMALKVIARHRLDPGLEPATRLTADPNPRVRDAAHRARRRLTTSPR